MLDEVVSMRGAWRKNRRNLIFVPASRLFGAVLCLPGRASARRSLTPYASANW